MKNRVNPVLVLSAVNRWLMYAIVFFTPLLFLVGSSDAFELPKQTLLVVGAAVVITLWLVRMIADQNFQWLPVRGWVWLVAFFVSVIASTLLSAHPFTSLVGDYGQEWGSLVTIVAVALLGLVAVQELDESGWLGIIFAFLLSSLVVSTLFLLGLGGIFVWPWAPAQTALFTPFGDILGLGMFSAIAIILASAKFFILGLRTDDALSRARKASHSTVSIILLSTIIAGMGVLMLIGVKLIWIVLAVSELILYLIIVGRAHELTKTHRWVVVFAVVVVAIFFVMVPSSLIQKLPPILIMNWSESRVIVEGSLQSSPVFGSGPATFSLDVNHYHTPEALRQSFGYLFDRSHSALLTHLAQLGIIAMVFWVLFCLFSIIIPAIKAIAKQGTERRWLILITMGSGWIVSLSLLVLFPSTIALEFVFGMLTAGMLWALAPSTTHHQWGLGKSPRARIVLLSTACVVFLSIPLLTMGSYRRVYADRAFYQSRRSDLGLDERRDAVGRAINKYPWSDVYIRSFGTLQLAKFQETLEKKPNSEERTKELRLLARDTILASRAATQLNGKSAANWQVLAGIYQQLIPFVDGSEEEAVKSLERLRELEPNNPGHPTELASMYIARADREQAKGDKADKKIMDNALIDAEDLLKKALVLDPEFATAHFQMAIIEERRGKLPEAIARVEKLAGTRPEDLPLHLQLGALYLKNNQKDLAEKVWKAIIAVKGDYANARWYLANLYEEEALYDDELAQLSEIQKTNKDNPQLVKKIEDVTKLKETGGKDDKVPAPLNEKIPLPADDQTAPKR